MIRSNAAQLILDKGLRFKIPAPFLSRLFGRDKVVIKSLRAGTIFEFASVVIDNKLEEALMESNSEMLSKSINAISLCIAIAILNDKKKIKRYSKRLSERLMWKISVNSLIDVFHKISILNRVSDFMNITKFFVIQTSTMMNVRGSGQMKGS